MCMPINKYSNRSIDFSRNLKFEFWTDMLFKINQRLGNKSSVK